MIPNFPPDATILSILAAVRRLACAHTSNDGVSRIVSVYARARAQIANLSDISATILDKAIPPLSLASNHSSLAFHGKFLAREDEQSWCLAATLNSPLATRNLREQMRFNSALVREPSYCPLCADYDLRHYGCAHWHVGHQLAGIYHCPTHETRLLGQCAECQAAFRSTSSRLRLPGDPCSLCGCTEATSPAIESPPAYWPYLRLCRRALEDGAPELRPAARRSIVSMLHAHSENTQTVEPLRDRLLRATLIKSRLAGWSGGGAAAAPR